MMDTVTAAATTDLWPAPTATGPLDAIVPVPGSKSVTNRALLLAALADGASRIDGALRASDTDAMITGLRALGTTIDRNGAALVVAPAPLHGPATVHCGLSGTVSRFLTPVAALAAGDVLLDGDPPLRARPLGPLVGALRELGADLDDGGRGRLPVTVHGHGALPGGAVRIDAAQSSQFLSALLLAAPRFEEGLTLTHAGADLPSRPYLALTVAMLRAAGATVDDAAPGTWRVRAGRLGGTDTVVEPDLMNAAPFLAAALVTGGRVTVPRWPAETAQAGDALRSLLARLGAEVTLDAGELTVRGTGTIHGLTADLRDAGELAPTIAGLAALADSPSHLTGIAHLRHHETDRLTALARELGALGADLGEEPDGLQITPKPLHGGVFSTYDDHRLATTGALLGLAVPGISVRDVATTAKTMPGFVELWLAMLGGTGVGRAGVGRAGVGRAGVAGVGAGGAGVGG